MKMTFAEQLQAIKEGKTVKQAMEEAAQRKTASYNAATAKKYLEELVRNNQAHGVISDFPGAKDIAAKLKVPVQAVKKAMEEAAQQLKEAQARAQGSKDARALFTGPAKG